MRSTRAFGHLRNILAVGVSVLAAIFVWQTWIGPNVFAKRFAVVEAGKVYRSGELSPAALRRVHEAHGIKTIIDFGANPIGSAEDERERRSAESLGMARIRYELSGDGSGNPNMYVRALEIMTDAQSQPVLVHCAAGTERTGIAVILYRHIVQGVPLDTAIAEADSRGHDPDRNPVLARVLQEWAGPIEQAYRSGRQVPGAAPVPDPAIVASPD